MSKQAGRSIPVEEILLNIRAELLKRIREDLGSEHEPQFPSAATAGKTFTFPKLQPMPSVEG
jgi:hypothetical protein